MDARELQGWYADPFGVHEARYFSAGHPTKLVRDGEAEAYDEPPPAGHARFAAAGTPTRPAPDGGDTPGALPGRPFEGGDYLPGVEPAGLQPAARRGGVTIAVCVVAACVAAALAAVLSGGGHGSSAPMVTGPEVYASTVAAGSADVSATASITSGARPPRFGVTEAGALSWTLDQGEFTIGTSAPLGEITVREIIDGTSSYTKLSMAGVAPRDRAGMPALDGWTEDTWTSGPDAGRHGFLQGVFGLLGAPSGGANPAGVLDVLRAESTSVTYLGAESIGGVRTARYAALVPWANVVGRSIPAADLRQVIQALGTDALAVDYWIDAAHRLRRLTFGITLLRDPDVTATTVPGETSASLAFPLTESVRLDLSDYGTPVHVTPPPANQITSTGQCSATSDGGFECDTAGGP